MVRKAILRFVVLSPAIMGLALLVGAGVYDVVFVNIPYQDPPPYLRNQWEHDSHIASAAASLGGRLFVCGVVWLGIAWLIRRSRRGPRK
jgi:hypothetical protein